MLTYTYTSHTWYLLTYWQIKSFITGIQIAFDISTINPPRPYRLTCDVCFFHLKSLIMLHIVFCWVVLWDMNVYHILLYSILLYSSGGMTAEMGRKNWFVRIGARPFIYLSKGDVALWLQYMVTWTNWFKYYCNQCRFIQYIAVILTGTYRGFSERHCTTHYVHWRSHVVPCSFMLLISQSIVTSYIKLEICKYGIY